MHVLLIENIFLASNALPITNSFSAFIPAYYIDASGKVV